MLVLQIPAVQTGLARYVSGRLDSIFNGRIEIGAIQIHPFNAITVKDLVLIDPEPYTADEHNTGLAPVDTVARVGKLSATVHLKAFLNRKCLMFGRVEAEDLLFQLAIEPDSTYGNNLTRVLKLVSSGKESKMRLDSIFTVNRLKVRNAHFRMLNFNYKSSYEHGMNWGDLDVHADIAGHGIGFWGGRMHAVADKITAYEKSGFDVRELSGRCHVGMGKTELYNLRLLDGSGSDIDLPRAVLSYSGTKAWSNFVHEVDMDIDFNPSRLVLESISNFSGGTFRGCKFKTDILSGHFRGTVSDFFVEQFDLETPYGPSGKVDVHMYGLPSIMSTSMEAKVQDLKFTSSGLEAALADLGANAKVARFAPGTEFTLKADASGPMNKLTASAWLSSAIGRLDAKASMRNMVDRDRPIELGAALSGRMLDLGRLLASDALGPSNFTAKARGTFGSGRTAIYLEDLDIARLEALEYNYTGLKLAGSFVNGATEAKLHSDDPNADLDLEGMFDLKRKKSAFKADLRLVDLAAINIDKRGTSSTISCGITGEQGISIKSPVNIQIDNLILTNDSGVHHIGDIDAVARLDGNEATVILSSDVVDAKYNGTSDFASLIKYGRSITIDRALPEFFNAAPYSPGSASSGPAATLSAVFHETKGLLAFAMPGLAIAPETTLNLDIDGAGTALGYINSPALAYNGISAKGLKLALNNQDDNFSCTVDTDLLNVNNMAFNAARLDLEAADNRATLGVNYEGSDLLDKGSELNLSALLSRDNKGKPAIDLSTLQSFLRIKEDVWELHESEIQCSNGEIKVDGFLLASENQSISLDGGVSPFRKDSLKVLIHNLNLDILNDFLSEKTPSVGGIIDGDALLMSPLPSEIGLGANLTVKDLSIDGKEAGDVALISDWDDTAKRIHLRLDNVMNGTKVLNINGKYGVKDKKVNAIASFDGFRIAPAAPFLRDFLSEFDGKLHGTLTVSGTTDKINLASDGLRLDKVRTRVVYTNVAYTLDGSVSAGNKGLTFNNIKVTDDYDGKGVLSGSLNFRELKDFKMDATLRMLGLKAIDIPDPESRIMIYGDLALTGVGKIKGPFNALSVDADVRTAGSGNVNVPLSGASTAQTSDLLTFKEPAPEEGVTEVVTSRKERSSSAKFIAHAKVGISPEVIANVEIDKESGHVLTAGGNGDVVVDINTGKGKLQLKGDYNIDKGKYLFNIPGIVSKEFDIKNGSSIKLNGDVKESTLDIDATHTVKTSLSSLVADSTNVSTRRSVICGIHIGGKLTSPEVKFSIDVPDLDPSTKMQVDAALSTDDKVQKQFVALLLFGTFLPEEGSGVVNGTNMIISNVGEIVSSQLNNILQKLDIPLDFGLGYQQDNVGTNIFDVAVSTQLFNNRVVVNGSVGNRKYSTSKNTGGDFVGDIDIEVKLDKNGEVRVKAFSHSADEFSSSLDFSQRNGIGMSYQKEFDHFIDLIRHIFMSRQRRTEEAIAEMARNRKMKTITIE